MPTTPPTNKTGQSTESPSSTLVMQQPLMEPDDAGSNYLTDIDDLTSSSLALSRILLVTLASFFVVSLIWAGLTSLDESIRGSGKITASSNNKRIQNHEGGIISEICVKEGQVVNKGEVLIKLDPVQLQSQYRGRLSEYYDKLANVARLEAEAEGREAIDFPLEVLEMKPDTVASQQELIRSRRRDYQATRNALVGDVSQKHQEYKELLNKLDYQRNTYKLIKQELDMTRPLATTGAVSEIDLLKLERQYNEAFGMAQDTKISLPKAKAALEGAEHHVAEHDAKFRSDTLGELNEARMALAATKELLPALKDQVTRTFVRAPVDGIVKSVFVHTIGESIPPGRDLMEIVPQEDTLLVVAQVAPQDIAFIHPGQDANVKITAYDFAVYGSLIGKVEQISADAIVDIKDPQSLKSSYYEVKIRTDATILTTKDGRNLPIIPGMIAEVDILTGKKTVLDYILKPILRSKQNAFTER